MPDLCHMIADPLAFRAILDRLRSATDISSRLPSNVFGPRYAHHQFLEFDRILSNEFWAMLQLLMAASADSVVNLVVLDPDPEAYFYQHFGRFGALELPRGFSADQYLTAVNTGPESSPVDAPGTNSFVLVWEPPSARWLIWAERDTQTMILAYEYGFDGPSASVLAESGMYVLTVEDALDISSTAWSDREAQSTFARELLKQYGDGQPWNDRNVVRALDIAHRLIDGALGTIEASRAMASLSGQLDGLEDVFLTFKGIDSETDNLPIGPVRAEWHPKALEPKDVEIRRYERLYGPSAVEACTKLIEHFRTMRRD